MEVNSTPLDDDDLLTAKPNKDLVVGERKKVDALVTGTTFKQYAGVCPRTFHVIFSSQCQNNNATNQATVENIAGSPGEASIKLKFIASA